MLSQCLGPRPPFDLRELHNRLDCRAPERFTLRFHAQEIINKLLNNCGNQNLQYLLVPSRLEPRSSCSIYTSPNRFLPKPPIQPEDVHTLIYHRRLFVVLRSYILRSYVPLRDLTRSCRRQFISYLDLPWSKAARRSSPFCKGNVPRRPA